MNVYERKLYDYLTFSTDWKNEAKGTISKEYRFIHSSNTVHHTVSVHYTELDTGRLRFVIGVNGWYLYFNPEMTVKDFKTIIDNVR